RRSLERLPGVGRQISGQRLQVRQRFIAEEETYPRVRVPAIQVFGLRKLGSAAEQYLLKATPKEHGQDPIDFGRCSFLRGAIRRAVDQSQHFAGLGQTQYQDVVAPSAVI